MSKFNASKWIDVLGLIATVIGIVGDLIDKWSNNKKEKNEKKETEPETQKNQ